MSEVPFQVYSEIFKTLKPGAIFATYLAHKKRLPPQDPTVALCLGTYGDRMGVGISSRRGSCVGVLRDLQDAEAGGRLRNLRVVPHQQVGRQQAPQVSFLFIVLEPRVE